MTREQFAFTPKAPARRPFPAGSGSCHVPPRLDAFHGTAGGVERKIDGMKYRFAGARSSEQLDLASELVTKRYAWRGYDAEGALGASGSAGDATFLAHCSGRVDGTLTVRIDSQTGLLAEQLYPEEIADLRQKGARLCEFGRLAFDEGVNTLEILGPLSHLGMGYARQRYACTDLVIEVNPRHVGFYLRAFGGTILGDERICDRVVAPALLLHLPLGEAMFQAHMLGGSRAGRRSIYPYFFGRDELAALNRELTFLDFSGEERKRKRAHAIC